MLKKRKLALALLCVALLLAIGALLVYSVMQEQKRPSGGSRFVCAQAAFPAGGEGRYGQ